MNAIPWIDQAKLKAQADRLIPLIEAVDRFFPGAAALNEILNVLRSVVDDDAVRIPVVELINELTGATPPA